jgi:predicted anti-sigma-YlaC factor YlaD
MTMDCAAARALLLEADPAELRGEVDSPLAAHLRACAGCRSAAEAILAGEAELDAALRAIARPSVGTRIVPLRPARGRGRRMMPAAASFAALAAAVVGVMLSRPHTTAPRGATTEQIAQLMFPAPPVARAGAGKSVAVLKTSDPGVTVVWVY